MATKPVTVSPPAAAAAGCAATCVSYATGTEAGVIDFTNYQFAATTVGNWRIVRFDFDEHTQSSTGGDTVQSFSKAPGAAKKYPADADRDYSARLEPFEDDYTDGTYHEWTTLENCVAVFELRTPTHLLVNSSTTENPAKLVYDPTTNLLVADY